MSKLQTFTILCSGVGGILGGSWGFDEGMIKYLEDKTPLINVPMTAIFYSSVGAMLGACWFISFPSGGVWLWKNRSLFGLSKRDEGDEAD